MASVTSAFERRRGQNARVLVTGGAACIGSHICVDLLRYFNLVCAHWSGRIDEDPNGTGVRGYVHVVDLAEGHLKALKKLTAGPEYD